MRDAETFDSVERGSNLRVFASPRQCVSSVGLDFERQARGEGFCFIAGVDEVGRGCLAGPVVAAACILDPDKPLAAGLNDSKKLTPKRRTEIAEYLKQNVLAYAMGQVEAKEIDRINILRATKRAMKLAVEALRLAADFLLIDALQLNDLTLPQKAIIKGDSTSASIAAASVLAKTYRDALMRQYDLEYPQYGFGSNAGYGTAAHFAALRAHGPCPLHRKTFRGVV